MIEKHGDPVRKQALYEEDQPLFGRGMHLGDRLYTFIVVRFLVAAGIVVAAYFAHYIVGIQGLNLRAFVILAAVLFCCNSISYLIARPYRGNYERANARRELLILVMDISIAIDFLCLTAALWLVGGSQSPFQAFFIFNVIIASVLLSPRATFAYVVFGYALFALMVVGTWRGCIPAHYPDGAVPRPGTGPLDGRYVITVLVVQGLLFALTALLMTYLMRLLRDGARQLRESNRALDRLSKQRRDFLQIALHNLRSPIGAVSMLLSNLAGGYAGALNEQQGAWVDRAQLRLHELTAFLRDLESLALLESGDLEPYMQNIDLRALLENLVEENQDLVQQHRHTLTLEVAEDLRPLRGVPRLIREAVVNFLTNAVKYTLDGGRIAVRAMNREQCVRIEVEDNGVGIAYGDQTRLFQEFVRVHKTHAEVAKVPGSGLGLVIVRRIAEAHGGRIDVRSVEGQGSVFAIELPA